VDSILHSSTEKCPECGEGAPSDLVCEVLTKENRSILLKLLESPNLRLLQETGQLFQRNNFFLSDVAENMLTGLEKEVFEMYHLEGMNMASIAIHLDLTLSQTLQIYNEATSKL
jgi:DNA-directed RNA polymerase specialized sigma subunit